MITKIEKKLLLISNLRYQLLLLVVAGIRIGVSPIGKEWFGWLLDASKSFPEASSYLSYSPIPVLLLKLLGFSNPYFWWFLWLLLYIGWLFLCFHVIQKKFGEFSRLLQLVLVMSQSVMINFTMIGHYDNLIFIASSLLLLFESKFIYFLSAFMVAGANPYIGFASGVCFAFYYCFSLKQKHLEIAINWLFVNLIFLIGLHFWYTAPESGTRESIVLGQFGEVIRQSLGVWLFIPLTILGPLTPLFLILALKERNFEIASSKIRFACLMISIFIIPITLAYLILDHTRIGVSTGGIVLLLYVFENHARLPSIANRFNLPLLSTLLLIWILTPPLMVDSGGVFRLPYLKYLHL